ncbi:hypothetical protein [Pseudonocardia phyllosphaerae]|uniref:hypothetical protein n=1 Tax=Pseudonocardia phyllosphaerae TaxID=3390502 RepID=UPI00397AABB0
MSAAGRPARRTTLLLGLSAVVALPIALLVPALADADDGDHAPPVLTSDDRAALGGGDLERGADPLFPVPAPSAPEGLVRAYLVAAHGAGPGDAVRTRRDAVTLTEPGGPAAVGTPVLDAPPPGARRIAVVDALAPAEQDLTRGRQAYLADVRTTTAAPGGTARTERWRTRVVLHRGDDGRWRVLADVPLAADPTEPGE